VLRDFSAKEVALAFMLSIGVNHRRTCTLYEFKLYQHAFYEVTLIY